MTGLRPGPWLVFPCSLRLAQPELCLQYLVPALAQGVLFFVFNPRDSPGKVRKVVIGLVSEKCAWASTA